MRSWPYFIWIKRLSPLVVIAVLWFAYDTFTDIQQEKQERLDQKYALVTATVWVASAQYRDDSEAYVAFRDSVLSANGLSAEQMFAYLDRRRKQPEKHHPFAVALDMYVDSLYKIEDSLRRIAEAEAEQPDSSINP